MTWGDALGAENTGFNQNAYRSCEIPNLAGINPRHGESLSLKLSGTAAVMKTAGGLWKYKAW